MGKSRRGPRGGFRSHCLLNVEGGEPHLLSSSSTMGFSSLRDL